MGTQRVAVIGTGSWGTAASGLLARNCADVTLLARTGAVADSINQAHRNPRHLRGYVLPNNVGATIDPAAALDGADAVVVATPSAFLRSTMRSVAPHVPAGVPVVVLTKGMEEGTLELMSEVVGDEVGDPNRIAALSGPNHAEEICRDMVSAAVVASPEEGVTRAARDLFVSPDFRVYCSHDLRGVEVCGAVKNVIAIACGICWGLGMGDNTLAVLMTRGLAEIGRIVSAVGGDPMTCMGLAGMGDLVATCTSSHSRNRTFGEAFARGTSLEEYEARTGMVVEGAKAVRGTWELACERGIETPITRAVHAILYEGMPMDEARHSLLDRDPNEEFYGL